MQKTMYSQQTNLRQGDKDPPWREAYYTLTCLYTPINKQMNMKYWIKLKLFYVRRKRLQSNIRHYVAM